MDLILSEVPFEYLILSNSFLNFQTDTSDCFLKLHGRKEAACSSKPWVTKPSYPSFDPFHRSPLPILRQRKGQRGITFAHSIGYQLIGYSRIMVPAGRWNRIVINGHAHCQRVQMFVSFKFNIRSSSFTSRIMPQIPCIYFAIFLSKFHATTN